MEPESVPTTGIKTRICIISDTHARLPSPPHLASSPFRYPLPKADVLLHAGDLTMVGRKLEHQTTRDLIKDFDAELKIVIAGNHDITLDEDYYAQTRRPGRENLAEIRELWTGPEARQAGIVYMDEGVQTFSLRNGARFTVYASPWQPEFCYWAFGYNRAVDRFNPPPPPPSPPSSAPTDSAFQAPHPVPAHPGVDIMITHGPPRGILDRVRGSNESVGCDHLMRAVVRARPRLHVFGHIHEGYGAERMVWSTKASSRIELDPETVRKKREAYCDVSGDSTQPLRYGEQTLFVNASILNVGYKPMNAPWVVDIDLPPATDAAGQASESPQTPQ
jgi:Calcineurin-like phosphoesterase